MPAELRGRLLVEKPFSQDALLNAINCAIGQARHAREATHPKTGFVTVNADSDTRLLSSRAGNCLATLRFGIEDLDLQMRKSSLQLSAGFEGAIF